MRTKVLSLALCSVLVNTTLSTVFGQSPSAHPPAQAPSQSRPLSLQYNTIVGTDERLFVMMAALNVAGFDAEPAGTPPSTIRKQLRQDVTVSDPQLAARLQRFFRLHLQKDRDQESQAIGYIALAFALGAPPTFAPPPSREFLPDDVNEIVECAQLLTDFYAKSNIKSLIPKYAPRYNQTAALLQRTVDEQVGEVLLELHTRPILLLPGDATPLSRGSFGPSGKKSEKPKKQPPSSVDPKLLAPPPRTRRLFILPDLFGPSNRVYTRNDVLNGADRETIRRIGDDYVLVVGPHANPPATAIRLTLLRFVLEPVVARSGVMIALHRPEITDLMGSLSKSDPKTDKIDEALQQSVFEIVRESLIRAAEARIRRRNATKENPYTDEDALYDVGTAYERGAVLAFHFYEKLDLLDKADVDIADWLPKMLETFDAAREKKRPGEYTALRDRVKKHREELAARTAPDTAAGNPLVEADALLLKRRYAEARPILEAILKDDPKNARAVFGLAQITSSVLSAAELDEKTEEGDKIAAQEERLAKAVDLYRKAVSLAKPEEKWLMSQAYVLIGHIYDFAQLREAAVTAYEQAIAIGDVPEGAYKEALEGKQRPFREK